MFSGAVTNKQSTLFLKSIFLTCLIFFKSVDPAFSGLRKKKGFAKFSRQVRVLKRNHI